jgi:cation transport regulator ChaC
MPPNWVFAYGSLLPVGTAKLPPDARRSSLAGWQRSWGVAMDNGVDLPGYKHFVAPGGERPDLMVAFLDITPRGDASVNGVALPVSEDELPGLDARERNYRRVDVSGAIDPDLPGRAWTYVGLEAARERLAVGRREGRVAIASDYLERVLAGFDLLGERELFTRSTAPRPAAVLHLEMVLTGPRAEPRSAVATLRRSPG